MKREMMIAKQHEEVYTFKPRVNGSGWSDTPARASSAPKSRPSWMSSTQGTDKFDENNNMSLGNSLISSRQTLTQSGNSNAKVFARLYATRNDREADRQVAKEEQFFREMRYCTFSPAIPTKKHPHITHATGAGANTSSSSATAGGEREASQSNSGGSRAPVWERLHDDKMSVTMLREEIKAQMDLVECTFMPAVNVERKDKVSGGAARGVPFIACSRIDVLDLSSALKRVN